MWKLKPPKKQFPTNLLHYPVTWNLEAGAVQSSTRSLPEFQVEILRGKVFMFSVSAFQPRGGTKAEWVKPGDSSIAFSGLPGDSSIAFSGLPSHSVFSW